MEILLMGKCVDLMGQSVEKRREYEGGVALDLSSSASTKWREKKLH